MYTASLLFSAIAWLLLMPVAIWALGLLFRVLGWTLRLCFGILLAPLWLVLMLLGGVATAMRYVLPFALVWLAFSAFTSEG